MEPLLHMCILRSRNSLDLFGNVNIFVQYDSDATDNIDYEYEESDEQDPELVQRPSQTIATFVPAPTILKEDHKCK